jgi:ABC-type bacteriocin/lantibiotic exporter with double-glycine peptidase domain
MYSRLRSNDAVKRSCANVAGTVSIDVVVAVVTGVLAVAVVAVVVAVVAAVAALVAVVGELRLTMLAQDIESVFRRADDCLHWV